MSVARNNVEPLNFNRLRIPTDGTDSVELDNHSCHSADAHVEVVFRDLPSKLQRVISEADGVVGCVAWLTHPKILETLARKRFVSIIVNKEDFLRPDVISSGHRFKDRLRKLYAALPGGLTRYDQSLVNTQVSYLSTCSDSSIDAIRCVGVTAGSRTVRPRMHHKFLVFCKEHELEPVDEDDEGGTRYSPYAVWTGSFNFTATAERSFENAVIIGDFQTAYAYFREWATIAAISESLDWFKEYVAPEWRIGT